MKRKRSIKGLFFEANIILFYFYLIGSFFGHITRFSIGGHTFGPSIYISAIAFPLFAATYFPVLKERLDAGFYARNLIPLACVLLFSSLGASYFLYPTTDGLFGTNPFKVWGLNSLKYFYDLFSIFYCIFFLSIINLSQLKKVATIFFWCWASFGLIQTFVYLAQNPTINRAYDAINFLGIFQSSDTMARILKNYGYIRIAIFGSEPASNGVVVFCFIVPALIYRFFELKKKKGALFSKIRLGIAGLLVILLTFLTRSSSVFVGGAALFFLLFICYLSNERIAVRRKAITAVGVLFGTTLTLFIANRFIDISSIASKLFNPSDYSTQHRYSTIWNDLVVFAKSPIIGVGDGNQGYFYFENVVGTWMANNKETQDALKGNYGLLGGGAFVPSFVSGYGILGLVLLTLTFRRYFLHAKKVNGFYAGIRRMLIHSSMGVIGFLAVATAGLHYNVSFYLVLAMPALCSASSVTKGSKAPRWYPQDLTYEYKI